MDKNPLYNLKGLTPEEYSVVKQLINGMTDQQAQQFAIYYSGKRQSPGDFLLFTLIGLVLLAGLHRFIIGQYGMGILYFLTCGLCFIGTIVDAINHKSLATEYNQKIALECNQLVRMQMI